MANARIFHFEKLEIEGTVAGYSTIQVKECWEEFFLPGAVTQVTVTGSTARSATSE